MAAPAAATESISSLSSTLSSSAAGAHPDIRTSFSMADPAGSEVPREVELQMPEGIFGNPGAATLCKASQFGRNECEPGSQVGVITIRADYEGNAEHVMGTAPVYSLEPSAADETARLAFVVPTVEIPIEIPVTVRTGSDYGLSFTVSGISQKVPLAGVDLTVWGIPALVAHNTERFPSGSPGAPSGCPGELGTGCIVGPPFPEAGLVQKPFIDNPSECTGEPLPVHSRSAPTRTRPTSPAAKPTCLPPTAANISASIRS